MLSTSSSRCTFRPCPDPAPDRIVVTVAIQEELMGLDQPVGRLFDDLRVSSQRWRSPRPISSAAANTSRSAPRRASTAKGWGLSFTEPYFLDQRLAAGFDVFHKEQDQNRYALDETWRYGRQPASWGSRSPTSSRSSRTIRSTNRRSRCRTRPISRTTIVSPRTVSIGYPGEPAPQ